MAYNRGSRSRARSYSRRGSTGRRRAPARRAVSSRRRTSAPRSNTLRIVIEQPNTSDVARPQIGVKTTTPRRSKF